MNSWNESGDNALALLKDLVAIPSVNPAFRTETDDPAIFGEGRCAARLGEFLSDAGCEVWFEEVLPGRSNLLAKVSNGGKATLALQSHLDTVQIQGMTVEPFGRLDGGRFYGRGACDTKAAAAVFAQVMKHAVQTGAWGMDLFFIGTVDEEYRFSGARAIGKSHRFDGCIVGEPTGLRVITAHKGSVRFDLVADGLAAHSSVPERGRNAIFEMMSLLEAFRPAFDAFTERQRHPLTGPATWAPTLIRGGMGLNTVPDRCGVSIDRRTIPGEVSEEILSFVDRWLEGSPRGGQNWHRGDLLILDPPMETDSRSLLVQAFQRALAECGLDATPKGVPYGTDASKINASGTPCVVFGPGDVAQAHTKDEWILESEVTRAVEVVIRAVDQMEKLLREK